MVWDSSVWLSVHSKSSQMITCIAQLPNSAEEVAISYVYAVNCKYGRRDLWVELCSLPLILLTLTNHGQC